MACTPRGRRPRTAWAEPRSIARLGRTVITYRSHPRRGAAAGVATVALVVAGGVAGPLLPLGTVAAAVMLVWAASTLRVLRLKPACSGPGGGTGPDGAGVREPRRPKPNPPSGAVHRPLPGDPDGGTATWA